jgi:hypothetical protein
MKGGQRMLELIIGDEGFDQDNDRFVLINAITIELEHSLAALSKWESKYKKPFLSSDKSVDELTDYIKMMCLTPNVPPEVFQKLDETHYQAINEYINDPMTATWFGKDPNEKPGHKIITAEVIYYWMSTLGVPFECENWHLNRLITLVRVINIENSPKKKMDPREAARQQREINMRRLQQGSRG